MKRLEIFQGIQERLKKVENAVENQYYIQENNLCTVILIKGYVCMWDLAKLESVLVQSIEPIR